MPNWVNNTVTVNGDPEEIKKFKEKAAQSYSSHGGETHEAVFSFWNFKRPPQEALDNGEYYETHGFSPEKGHTGQTTNNWYNWNSTEWGTKWDACRPETVWEDASSIQYTFDTAWSMPEPVFEAMVAQHPKLKFDIYCIEEQGWGMEYRGIYGELNTVDEWDIPSTHEESMKRTESCQCEWYDGSDPDEWKYLFDDCPAKNLDTAAAIEKLEKVEASLAQ